MVVALALMAACSQCPAAAQENQPIITSQPLSMDVLLDQTTASSSWSVSNLGDDVMQQAGPFVINFRYMEITFRNEH